MKQNTFAVPLFNFVPAQVLKETCVIGLHNKVVALRKNGIQPSRTAKRLIKLASLSPEYVVGVFEDEAIAEHAEKFERR